MASANVPAYTVSLLTDGEKWLFDLHGYLLLQKAVPPADVVELLSELNAWCDAPDDPPKPLTRGEQPGPSGPSKTHVSNPHYGSAVYQRLNLNPEILRVVSGMMMGSPRLMHSVATRMQRSPESDPLPGFHRDTDGFVFPLGFRNPHNDYQTSGGELYCSHVATWVALRDVPDGTGFCIIPGSHKSSFEAPADIKATHNPPVSVTVPVMAGDVIVFSTGLLHAASKWTVQDYPRCNVFQRFQLSAYFGLGEKSTNFQGSGYPMEEYRDHISDEQYELESPSKQEKEIVKNMRNRYKLANL